MATTITRKGPSKGSRIPVELPFGQKTSGGKFPVIFVKENVAEVLGLATTTSIKLGIYSTKNPTASKAGGSSRSTTKRYKRGSYRRKSIKIVFKGTGKKLKGNKRNFKTVSCPMPLGVHVSDFVEYLQTKVTDAIAVVTPDGRRIQWKADKGD